jgi:hypothetical protein
MFTSERVLVVLLRLGGAALLLALPAAFLPFAWMDAIHHRVGLGALPDVPIIGYLTRSISIMYAIHGALILFLSFNVRRYLPVIRFLALTGLAFGLGMIWIDLAAGMPRHWARAEGPFIILESLVILWLAGRVSRLAASA